MKKEFFLITLLCLIALWPFFKKGYFESHDGEWMVIRFTAFHQSLVAGQFPVRFTDRLNNNYGYPVMNFLYPLPFYLSEIPKDFGFSFVDSVKIIFIVSTVSSALGMFWAASQLFGKWESLASSMVYIFIPYRFVDLYVRGSIGENLAFTFLPLVFGCIIKIAKGHKFYVPALAVFISALITSHNVIAVLFLPLFTLVSYLLVKKGKLSIISSFVLGLSMSAFFWVPALYDLKFVRLSQIKVSNIADHLANFSNLITPSWGYGLTPQDSLPVQVGIVSIFVFLTSAFLFFKEKKKNFAVGLLISIYVISLVMMTKLALPIWQIVPLIDTIQFPWRLLSLIVFITSVLTAYTITAVPKKNLMAVLVITASVTSTILYTKPRTFVDREDGYYRTNEATTTVADEYMPLWVKSTPEKRAYPKIVVENGEIISQNIKQGHYGATVKTNQPTNVWVNTIYFPGWQAKIDGKNAPISYQNQYGLITFNLPEGEHKVIINYTHSPVHLASELISLVGILITGAYFFTLWRKQNS